MLTPNEHTYSLRDSLSEENARKHVLATVDTGAEHHATDRGRYDEELGHTTHFHAGKRAESKICPLNGACVIIDHTCLSGTKVGSRTELETAGKSRKDTTEHHGDERPACRHGEKARITNRSPSDPCNEKATSHTLDITCCTANEHGVDHTKSDHNEDTGSGRDADVTSPGEGPENRVVVHSNRTDLTCVEPLDASPEIRLLGGT